LDDGENTIPMVVELVVLARVRRVTATRSPASAATGVWPVDQDIARVSNAAAGADGIDRDRTAAFVEIVRAEGRTS
jgi:hypothetical protein